MRKALSLLLFVSAAASLHAQNASPDQIRAAATRAVAITQQGSAGFYKFMTCFSCHDHALPVLEWQTARQHGVPVDETIAAQITAKGLLNTPNFTSIDDAVQDPGIIDPAPSDGWALVAAHAAGVLPNLVMAAYARRIATWQRPDGHWPTLDARPPQSYSLFTATAVAARAIQLYMPAQLREETNSRLGRAKTWLLANEPQSTEDATFRLFGLRFTDATSGEIQRATAGLLALQRADGGWGEIPHLPSDAYSTGEALVALNEAGGVAVNDAAWRKGLQYLVSTQGSRRGVARAHAPSVARCGQPALF
ncbi:MAG TPA: prenyltransferase/squalene oxidase repeat-containing protein [Terriglobia bacterium]|nr:prenyltransferase/squalene oxidase repeat-containing protein [Terriglobia bacterium]